MRARFFLRFCTLFSSGTADFFLPRAARKQTSPRDGARRVHNENAQEHCPTPPGRGDRAPRTRAQIVQNPENTKEIRFFAPMIFQWVSHPVSEIIRNQCYF